MQGLWEIVVTRLGGRPDYRCNQLSLRPPELGEELRITIADGGVVIARVTNFHHRPPHGGTSLGRWEIAAQEIA